MKRLATLSLLALGVTISGCGVNPITGERELQLINEKTEIAIGSEQYVPLQQGSGGVTAELSEVQAYVTEVGKRMAQYSDRPDLPYEFVVINSGVPNAWALPGGKIAINRGLLSQLENEAELAAVLGHEITHAVGRHGAKALERGILLQGGLAAASIGFGDSDYGDIVLAGTGFAGTMVTMSYSRDAERQADERSIVYLARAGYNPRAAATLQEKFLKLAGNRDPNWLEGLFASHPPSQERLERNRRLASQYNDAGMYGEADYQRGIAQLRQKQAAFDNIDAGRAALEKGQIRQAHRFAEYAAQLLPNEHSVYLLRGDVRLAQGDAERAVEQYDIARGIDSYYYYTYLQRGKAYMRMGQNGRAKEDFVRANKIIQTAEAHALIGQIDLDAGREKQAVAHFKVAVDTDPIGQQKALATMTRVEMSKQPDQYFHTYTQLSDDGYITLVVENRSVVATQDVVIRVGVRDQAGNERALRDVRVHRRLPAGHKVSIDTDIRVEGFDGTLFYDPIVESVVTSATPIS